MVVCEADGPVGVQTGWPERPIRNWQPVDLSIFDEMKPERGAMPERSVRVGQGEWPHPSSCLRFDRPTHRLFGMRCGEAAADDERLRSSARPPVSSNARTAGASSDTRRQFCKDRRSGRREGLRQFPVVVAAPSVVEGVAGKTEGLAVGSALGTGGASCANSSSFSANVAACLSSQTRP